MRIRTLNSTHLNIQHSLTQKNQCEYWCSFIKPSYILDCDYQNDFTCHNSGRCIPKGLQCDSYGHCKDNSDETSECCKYLSIIWIYILTLNIFAVMLQRVHIPRQRAIRIDWRVNTHGLNVPWAEYCVIWPNGSIDSNLFYLFISFWYYLKPRVTLTTWRVAYDLDRYACISNQKKICVRFQPYLWHTLCSCFCMPASRKVGPCRFEDSFICGYNTTAVTTDAARWIRMDDRALFDTPIMGQSGRPYLFVASSKTVIDESTQRICRFSC